ncbi:TolC family protein [Thermodesulfobacteriota bacterium]
MEARWSPTDAVLAYYLSRSSVNDSLKAHYQRVRVAQKLVATIDSAFFRLLGLQLCFGKAERLVSIRCGVERKTKKALDRHLTDIKEYNRVKREAIRAQRLRDSINAEIEKQRNVLASAMGLSPDYCIDGGFHVCGQLVLPCFKTAVCQMEMQAMQNRPEAFEAGLNHLNSMNDVRRTIVKHFPKVTGFWRATRDNDKFLYNKEWKEAGVFVYFDLLDWLSNLSESKATRFNSGKTQREMAAVALAIASQVRVAAVDYFSSLNEARSAQAMEKSSGDVLRIYKERADRDDLEKLALEEAQADGLQDRIERIRAVAESNAALAELQGAMGTNYNEPTPCD